MPVFKNVLGLDLGAHSLKAVELRQALRGIEAVQLRTLPRSEDAAPVAELVRQFVELHRFATDHVVTALPGDKLSTRRLEFPFGERRKLQQAVPFAVEEELPFNLEDVVIDWTVTRRDRTHASVLAAIAPRAEVSGLLSALDEAGCAPRTLEAEGLVLGNLAAIFDLPGRRLLADLGHTKTTLCLLVDEEAVATRTLPVGGRDLTQALADDRGLSATDAERAKCEEGIFESDGAAPPQTAKVLDRLVREIVQTQGAVEEILGGQGIDELTIFGGTALLGQLDAFLAEQTGIPTARLGLPREGTDEGLVAGGPPILFASAIALALRGTTQARTKLNFRQDEFAVRVDVGQMLSEFRGTAWLVAAVAGLAVLGFATRVALDSQQAAALEAQVERLYTDAFPDAAAPEDPLRALRDQVSAANDKANFLGVYPGNLSALDLLTELSRLVPPGLKISLEEVSIDGQTVRLRVRGKSFSDSDRVSEVLSKFGPFASFRVGSVENDPKTGTKRFNVTISMKPVGERE
jgi:general secretion pathway protein L